MSDSDEGEFVGARKVEDELDNIGGGDGDDDAGAGNRKHNMVHIQFQQRTTRKCLTLIQGLQDDIDFKKLVQHFKK